MTLIFFLFHTLSAFELTFGSCAGMFGIQNPEIWYSILNRNSSAFIWLGDVIYADIMILPMYFTVPSEAIWRKKYEAMKYSEGYIELRNSTKILGIWDDHDYGNNNENRYFSEKVLSKRLFLEFLDEPSDSIRFQREGLYISYIFYEGDLKVKVILLDDRTFLDPWSPHGDTLGEMQWEWLESELNDPSDLFLIMNGIQINVEDRISITEKWHENSRIRLLHLLNQHPNSILITGDVHYAEILEIKCQNHKVIELTTSGLTHSIKGNYGFFSIIFVWLWYPYTYNLTPRIYNKNFGSFRIDPNGDIVLKVHESDGHDSLQYFLNIKDLGAHIERSYLCEQSVRERQIKHLASVSLVFFLPVIVWTQIFLKFLQKHSNSY